MREEAHRVAPEVLTAETTAAGEEAIRVLVEVAYGLVVRQGHEERGEYDLLVIVRVVTVVEVLVLLVVGVVDGVDEMQVMVVLQDDPAAAPTRAMAHRVELSILVAVRLRAVRALQDIRLALVFPILEMAWSSSHGSFFSRSLLSHEEGFFVSDDARAISTLLFPVSPYTVWSFLSSPSHASPIHPHIRVHPRLLPPRIMQQQHGRLDEHRHVHGYMIYHPRPEDLDSRRLESPPNPRQRHDRPCSHVPGDSGMIC